MNKLKYSPEIICIVLFFICSMIWSYSTRQYEEYNTQLNELTQLETISIKLKVELLSANFNDSLHYDNFSQLQAQIEHITNDDFIDHNLKQLLAAYNKTSMNYMQLVTMIKTSKRLLSNKNVLSSREFTLLNTLKIKMFNYIALPDDENRDAAYAVINKLEKKYEKQKEISQVHLFRLHCLFILDNYENSAKYRSLLMDMPVLTKIRQSVTRQHRQIDSIQYNRYVSGFCSLLALILIFLIIFQRQQKALEKHQKTLSMLPRLKDSF